MLARPCELGTVTLLRRRISVAFWGEVHSESLFSCSSCPHSKKTMPVIALPALCLAMSYLWLRKLFWVRPNRTVRRSQGMWCKLWTSTCAGRFHSPGIWGECRSVAQAASAETIQQQVLSTALVAGTTLQYKTLRSTLWVWFHFATGKHSSKVDRREEGRKEEMFSVSQQLYFESISIEVP